jgi:hypothetical protein
MSYRVTMPTVLPHTTAASQERQLGGVDAHQDPMPHDKSLYWHPLVFLCRT